MSTEKRASLSAAISVAILMMTAQASAYEATAETMPQAEADDSAAKTLDTVTVTARGVRETLQKLPLPVTAISEETIERKGIVDMNSVANMTPGFSFKPAFGRWQEVPVIRGMSNISPPAAAEINTNASLFVDGIFVYGDMSALGLENVAQIEVLRGPQAAAFGRSTFAGAINYITRRPGDVPGGKLTLGFGNHGQEKLGLYYAGSSEDGSFGYELAFNRRGNDSLYHNAFTNRKDLGGTETTGIMGALAWSPTEKLDVVARVSRQKVDDDHVAIGLIGPEYNNCYLPTPTPDATDPPNYMVTRTKGYYCGDLPLPREWNIATGMFEDAGLKAGIESESTRYSLNADYSLENNWTINSTTGYNRFERYAGVDQSYDGVPALVIPAGPTNITVPGALQTFSFLRSKDWSQSLRLSSDQSLPVAGLVGLYYFKLQGLPGYAGDLSSGVPVANNPGNEAENRAIYGQLRWHINDRWSTSLEGRYAQDELSLDGSDTKIVDGVSYTRSYTASGKYNSFTPRWTVSYQAADNINLFGLIAKGNKPGGFNTFVYDARLTDEASAALISQGLDRIDEEKVTNYELGIKSDWLDNSLRLNANIYQLDWTNQGLTIASSVLQRNGTPYSSSYTVNVGETRIRGFEFEGQWAFAPGWLASLVYANTDSVIKNFFSQDQADLMGTSGNPNPGPDDPLASVAGNKSPLVPRNKLTLGLSYDAQLGNGWDLTANWDTTYESERYMQIHNLAKFGASTLSNFRISMSPNEAWRFSAYVNNVFDDDAPQGGLRYLSFEAPRIMVPNIGAAAGYSSVQQRAFGVSAPMPRMYGVEVSFRF